MGCNGCEIDRKQKYVMGRKRLIDRIHEDGIELAEHEDVVTGQQYCEEYCFRDVFI